ncbi:hypothetical protein [Aliiruegeria haliotis]|nr:hypothetical protein [Aliiruegeria haliotis]
MALNRQLDDEIKELVRDRMRAWRIRLEYYTTSAEAGERESAQIDAEEPLPNIPRKKDRR